MNTALGVQLMQAFDLVIIDSCWNISPFKTLQLTAATYYVAKMFYNFGPRMMEQKQRELKFY